MPMVELDDKGEVVVEDAGDVGGVRNQAGRSCFLGYQSYMVVLEKKSSEVLLLVCFLWHSKIVLLTALESPEHVHLNFAMELFWNW